MSLPERTAAWVRSVLGAGARVVEIAVLPDSSHTNHRLHVETSAGARLDLLLRRYTDAELLASNPWYSPADEVNALRALEHAQLPVPRLVAEDAYGDSCDEPTLLLTWQKGEPPGAPEDLDAFARGLAEPLPAIRPRCRCASSTVTTITATPCGDTESSRRRGLDDRMRRA